jgi:hypothetical protein
MSSDALEPPLAPEITEALSPVTQLSVFLHNRVGALLDLVRLMNENSIEVLGVSLQDAADLTLVRMVVSHPVAAQRALAAAGISCTDKQIVAVELAEGSHDLARALSALLCAEINIHHSYPLLVRPSGRAVLALFLDDFETGGEALSRSGFKVLSQDELSR